MRLKKRICLEAYIIFFAVSLSPVLFAQSPSPPAQEEAKDPFLSLSDKIKLSQTPFDVSHLPYPIVLNGIIWTQEAQIAIINGEMVEKNQRWQDFKVEEIKRDRVTLRMGENRIELVLEPEESNVQKKE